MYIFVSIHFHNLDGGDEEGKKQAVEREEKKFTCSVTLESNCEGRRNKKNWIYFYRVHVNEKKERKKKFEKKKE